MTDLVLDNIEETDDATIMHMSSPGLTFDTITFEGEVGHIEVGPLLFSEGTFTRSNGTIAARIYERLTRASRRKQVPETHLPKGVVMADNHAERAYRRGVKDTLEAMRSELS